MQAGFGSTGFLNPCGITSTAWKGCATERKLVGNDELQKEGRRPSPPWAKGI